MNISGINFGITQNISAVSEAAPAAPSKAPEAAPEIMAESADISDVRTASEEAAPKKTKSSKAARTETIEAPEIVVMREKGLETLVSMIDNAKESIDLHIYIVTANTPELTDAFHRALDRGVHVRLMIEDDPFYWTGAKDNPSKAFIDDMVARGAEYKPDNPKFSKSRVTHEKSMVFDGKEALILTGNLGSSTFGKNLDLGAIVLKDPKTVSQVETIFNSDWERTDLPDMGDTNLVISPDNARTQLHGLISGAKKDITVLQQAITDKATVDLLASKIDEGVKTDLTITDPGIAQNNMQPAAYLYLKGADVHFLVSPYIHAKAVSVDSHTADSKTYVGSQNFSMSAIDKNRELGYIFHDEAEQLGQIVDKYQKKGFEIPSKMLVTDPGAIGSSLKSAIRTATDKVVLETCLFSDSGTKTALKQAAQRGVDVSVIMPQTPFPWDPSCQTNITMAQELEKAGVKVIWSDPTNKPTAGTCMVVDGKESISYPDNVSRSAFAYNNSYGVINISQKEVSELDAIMTAKANGSSEMPQLSPTTDLVASPGNARQQLKSLISGAESSLMITTKELSDKEMIALIKQKAKKGVEVNILLPKRSPKNAAAIKELETAGVKFGYMTEEKLNNNYIEVDKEKAYSGSHSLSADSMDRDSAVGCMVTHPEMLRIGRGTFSSHWIKAAVLGAEKSISIEQAGIDTNRDLKDLIGEVCKKGVKIHVASPTYDTSTIKAEFELLNEQLREMAYLDASSEENLDALSKYFGTFFDTKEALEKQQSLREAIESLKPGEQLLTGEQKADISPNTEITADGKKVDLLPTRNEEIAQMNK